MSWFRQFALTVPSFQTENHRVFYTLEVRSREASARQREERERQEREEEAEDPAEEEASDATTTASSTPTTSLATASVSASVSPSASASTSASAGATSLLHGDTVTLQTHRSYTAFRTFYENLLSATQPLQLRNGRSAMSLKRRLRIKGCACCVRDQADANALVTGNSCVTTSSLTVEPCPFQKLHQALRRFDFPSKEFALFKRKTKRCISKHDKLVIETRRIAFEKLLTLVMDFCCCFSWHFLDHHLMTKNCRVMEHLVTFLGNDVRKSIKQSILASTSRPQLSLHAWRTNMDHQIELESMSRTRAVEFSEEINAQLAREREREQEPLSPDEYGDEEEEREEVDDEDEENGIPLVPLADAEGTGDDDIEEEILDGVLPRLSIKSVEVGTMQTYLEDFCNHLLETYGADLEELQSPELTLARKWELCLFVASRIGHTYAVQLILMYYARADSASDDGTTSLNIAARMGHAEVVKQLIENGADVNRANCIGITPLIAACRNGCTDSVRILLENGADVNTCSQRQTYPIHAAIVAQNDEIVELLVKSGADVNVSTIGGITPIHFAAKLGNYAVCQLLLHRNVDLTKKTKQNSDAIMIARANGHVFVYELLQSHAENQIRLSTTASLPPSTLSAVTKIKNAVRSKDALAESLRAPTIATATT